MNVPKGFIMVGRGENGMLKITQVFKANPKMKIIPSMIRNYAIKRVLYKSMLGIQKEL